MLKYRKEKGYYKMVTCFLYSIFYKNFKKSFEISFLMLLCSKKMVSSFLASQLILTQRIS